MKVALIGGHLSPALALIDALADIDVIFIGRRTTFEGDRAVSLEYKTISERGIPFYPITTGRLQRNIGLKTITSAFKFPLGFYQARQILKKEKPDVVIGFGGYVSVPVGLAAFFLKIPLVIHEQTLEAGMANKILSFFAKKVCVAWKSSFSAFPKDKTVLTGNPIRNFSNTNVSLPAGDTSKPLIYITGGSAGSHALNQLIEGYLEELVKKYRILHQVGDAREFKDYEKLTEKKNKLSETLRKDYLIEKFISPNAVGSIMNNVDFVISRSGMNTITEILLFGKPCLLIPLPHGQRDEQLKNAQLVKEIGLGEYLEQQKTTPDVFYKTLDDMVKNRKKYEVNESKAKSLVKKNAGEKIVEVLYEVVRKEK